jgi:hypothetical protein
MSEGAPIDRLCWSKRRLPPAVKEGRLASLGGDGAAGSWFAKYAKRIGLHRGQSFIGFDDDFADGLCVAGPGAFRTRWSAPSGNAPRRAHTVNAPVADSYRPVLFAGAIPDRRLRRAVGTRTASELRSLLDRGGVIMGTSAGAIAQGSFLMRGRPDKPLLMLPGPASPARIRRYSASASTTTRCSSSGRTCSESSGRGASQSATT